MTGAIVGHNLYRSCVSKMYSKYYKWSGRKWNVF